MSITTHHTRPADALHLSGALIGLVIFFVGIGLLYGVFQDAHRLFTEKQPPVNLAIPMASANPTLPVKPVPKASPSPASTPAPTPDATSTAVSNISSSLFGFIRQWLLLLLMCIAGSFIASRGIELFFRACSAALHPPKPASPP
jgi:hypothetical protein